MMKKILTMLSCLCLTISAIAQNSLISEIKTVPWDAYGRDIYQYYLDAGKLRYEDDSFSDFISLKDVMIDDYSFNMLVSIDTLSSKIGHVGFSFKQDSIEYVTDDVCKKVLEAFSEEFGRPDSEDKETMTVGEFVEDEGYFYSSWIYQKNQLKDDYDIDSATIVLQTLEWYAENLYIRMKIRSVPSCGCVNITAIVYSTKDCIKGFRSFEWGTPQSVIKAKERKSDLWAADDELYGFETRLNGRECLAAYYFYDDKLAEGRYLLTEDYYSGQSYISCYNDWAYILTEKYGEPDSSETKWINDKSKTRYSLKEGMALEAGKVEYSATWSDDLTCIVLSLAKGEYGISLRISYCSWKYYNARQQTRYADF